MSPSPRPSTGPRLPAVLAPLAAGAFGVLMLGAAVVAVLFGVQP